ncbi:zinc finger MYND domain-containing protein [Phanerochaete sordida]|uniref:Zinc finger MYND domain-containing protein n=1 Tax=Phanerochaete sordida TaxID=48140 RepID=A0A9P3G8A8_9APHY|nr:zinc finger MYND domain-containing protein [Phanerochaete sordida]
MPPAALPPTLGAGSDLQDRISFPTFADCPQLGDAADARYFHRAGAYRRHWCFLGEVTRVSTFSRLVLDVVDTAAREGTRVACYDDDGGRSFLTGARPPRVGDTVAVLYAQTKAFLDGTIGIRVEDNRCIRFLPHRLLDLLAANDALWGPRPAICCVPDCGESEDLRRCSKCQLVRYCGAEHQSTDWAAHKGICRALPTLKIFTDRDWTTYNRRITFQ